MKRLRIEIHVDVDAPKSTFKGEKAWIQDQIVAISDQLSPLPEWTQSSNNEFVFHYTGEYESSILALAFAKRIEALLQKHFGKAMHDRARIEIINC